MMGVMLSDTQKCITHSSHYTYLVPIERLNYISNSALVKCLKIVNTVVGVIIFDTQNCITHPNHYNYL